MILLSLSTLSKIRNFPFFLAKLGWKITFVAA